MDVTEKKWRNEKRENSNAREEKGKLNKNGL